MSTKSGNGKNLDHGLGTQDEMPKASLFGIDKNKFEILGDIISPLDVEWESNCLQDRTASGQSLRPPS